jgi:hypothetical protein
MGLSSKFKYEVGQRVIVTQNHFTSPEWAPLAEKEGRIASRVMNGDDPQYNVEFDDFVFTSPEWAGTEVFFAVDLFESDVLRLAR